MVTRLARRRLGIHDQHIRGVAHRPEYDAQLSRLEHATSAVGVDGLLSTIGI